jgi:hypothetical protein
MRVFLKIGLMYLIFLHLYGCSETISEAEEFKKYVNNQMPVIYKLIKPLDTNIWKFADRGEISVEQAKTKAKEQLSQCKDTVDYLNKISMQHKPNQLLINLQKNMIQAKCSALSDALNLVNSYNDPVKIDEYSRSIKNSTSVSNVALDEWKNVFSSQCKKFLCGDYINNWQ